MFMGMACSESFLIIIKESQSTEISQWPLTPGFYSPGQKAQENLVMVSVFLFLIIIRCR